MRFCLLIAISGLMAACASGNKSTTTVPAGPATDQQPVSAAKSEPIATKTSKVECTHGADSRALELREKLKGCEVGYTKNGKEAVVATSIKGNSHCEASMTKIKSNLVAAGFTCK